MSSSSRRVPGTTEVQDRHRPLRLARKRVDMFARVVTMQMRSNLMNEFPVTFEKEILPLLKKQRGFLDELLLVTPEKREVAAISLWETQEDAETYNRELYPQVEKIMGKFMEGIPTVKKYDAEYSTFHKLAFAARA
jgi:heme-degrading monooxygenase HmoA